MSPEPDDTRFYNDLEASLAELWRQLGRGAADRRSAMHTVQLATTGADDGLPRVRTLVLRGVEPEQRRLRLHTDRRSRKVAELAVCPRVELCAYDPGAKIQVRARGSAEILVGPAADAAWSASEPGSRICYGAPHAPGSLLDDPHDGDIPRALPDLPESDKPADEPAESGRAHFAVLLITVSGLDWLYLAARGHRRASFDWVDGHWQGHWRAP